MLVDNYDRSLRPIPRIGDLSLTQLWIGYRFVSATE
jgi:hypothetical protein